MQNFEQDQEYFLMSQWQQSLPTQINLRTLFNSLNQNTINKNQNQKRYHHKYIFKQKRKLPSLRQNSKPTQIDKIKNIQFSNKKLKQTLQKEIKLGQSLFAHEINNNNKSKRTIDVGQLRNPHTRTPSIFQKSRYSCEKKQNYQHKFNYKSQIKSTFYIVSHQKNQIKPFKKRQIHPAIQQFIKNSNNKYHNLSTMKKMKVLN